MVLITTPSIGQMTQAHRLIHQILQLMMAQLLSQEPLRLPQGFQMEPL